MKRRTSGSTLGSPVRYSEKLGRGIRQDGVDTLGVSTQTLYEQAVVAEDHDVARDLLEYFWDEMHRMSEALFTWTEDIFTYRFTRWDVSSAGPRSSRLLAGLRGFDPSSGDRVRAGSLLARGEAEAAIQAAELMRVRYAALHDGLVVWIQELLTDLSVELGEQAVFEAVEHAYHNLWERRYRQWHEMTVEERLQLSVEGMRGHLSGQRRRGDVGIIEEHDRFVLVLNPCGSCGVLRRGDPESGREPYEPAGNREPHDWTWGRTGVGWYAVHSPIVMEYLQMKSGRPPMRPLEDCDLDRPCRWFVYKDVKAARSEHYERMGFREPASSSGSG